MSNPIRVVQVFAEMVNEGSENMIMNVYRNIDRKKVQFDFIVHTERDCFFDEEIRALGGRIYRVPRYKGANHASYVKAWKALLSEHPEWKVLHSHVRSIASIYLPIAKKYGLHTIIHSHSTQEAPGFKGCVKRVLEFPLRYQADYFFACSKAAGAWLYGENILKNPSFQVIPNSVDLEKFQFSMEARQTLREELGVSEDTIIVGNVARFLVTKNHRFMMDIISRLNSSGDLKYHLVFAGEGDEFENCKAYAKEQGLESMVTFLGNRGDIHKLLSAFDVFLFPSSWEGLPVTLVEAQASGLPCVYTDTITDEVRISDCTMLPLTGDVAPWASAVENAYKNRVVLEDRANATEAVAKAGFDIRISSQKLEDFYIHEHQSI